MGKFCPPTRQNFLQQWFVPLKEEHYGDSRVQSSIVLGNIHARSHICILSEYWRLNLSELPCKSKYLMTEWHLINQGAEHLYKEG